MGTSIHKTIRNTVLEEVSYWQCLKSGCNHKVFDTHFRNFVLFSGCPRSGSTLVGALLNAMENVVISNELDIVGMYRRTMAKRENIVGSIYARDAWFYEERKAKQWGYNYAFPGTFQGIRDDVRVIGDKRAARTAFRLSKGFEHIERFERHMGIPIIFVHVVRNPFDTISTWAYRHGCSVREIIKPYKVVIDTMARLRSTGNWEIKNIFFEDITGCYRDTIIDLSKSLGIEVDNRFLENTESAIFKTTRENNKLDQWTTKDINEVWSIIENNDLLTRYLL